MKKYVYLFLISILHSYTLIAQNQEFSKIDTFKVTEKRPLTISFLYPDDWDKRTDWPILVFYYGGGWVKGSIGQFLPQAKHFAAKGTVCALVEYRVKNIDGTDPFTALADAKSAMRYIKGNSSRHRIDSSRVVAIGGSAGGHLAAACELVKGYDDPKDDLSVGTQVSALVLFNPVLDNGPKGYAYNRIGERYTSFSPFFQDKKDMADALIMLGTNDHLIPVETMQTFCESVRQTGSHCELVLYPGAKHGFFNKASGNGLYYEKTLQEMENFLSKKNFLTKPLN